MQDKRRYLAIYFKDVGGNIIKKSKVVKGIDRIRALESFTKSENIPERFVENDYKHEGILLFNDFNNEVDYV